MQLYASPFFSTVCHRMHCNSLLNCLKQSPDCYYSCKFFLRSFFSFSRSLFLLFDHFLNSSVSTCECCYFYFTPSERCHTSTTFSTTSVDFCYTFSGSFSHIICVCVFFFSTLLSLTRSFTIIATIFRVSLYFFLFTIIIIIYFK